MNIDQLLQQRIDSLFPHLTERQRRLVGASDAQALGYGGISRVACATGMSRTTIHQGLAELEQGELAPDHIRRKGGRRKKIRDQDPPIMSLLRTMVDPSSLGDPRSPLHWTCKSTRQLASVLTRKGHPVNGTTPLRVHNDDVIVNMCRSLRNGD